MFENLEEKINYEFDKYTAYMRLVSRVDFMTRAYEFSCKKAIYDKLTEEYEKGAFTQHELEMLISRDDLIDYMYAIGRKNIVLCNERMTDASWSYLRQAAKYN